MEKEQKKKTQPQQLPKPTYWPFLLAVGISSLLWGILTNIVVSAIGVFIICMALGGWINDLYKELKNEKKDEL